MCRACAHAIPSTAALVGPTEARPNLDPLPLYSGGEQAFLFCAVLDVHLSHAAEFVSLSRGLVLRWSFFLLVRWYPPLRSDSYRVANRLQFIESYPPYDDCDVSVVPRRLLLLESGAWLVALASRSAVRERVPWPNPRLAMLDTCRRMSSIEVVRLVSRGFGRPSTSHRIFGFRVARARFFLVLSARHPVDSFICAPL
jgi:hypothetical protein